eukprot:1562421-Pleurochrysis_carterae.AAC.10
MDAGQMACKRALRASEARGAMIRSRQMGVGMNRHDEDWPQGRIVGREERRDRAETLQEARGTGER